MEERTIRQELSLGHLYSFSVKKYLIWFCAWTAIGLLNAQTEILAVFQTYYAGSWWEPVLWSLTGHWAFGLIAPVIISLCSRWSFERGHRFESIIRHFGAYLVFAPAHTSLMLLMRYSYYGSAETLLYNDSIFQRYLFEFLKPMPGYFLIAFVTYIYIAQRKARKQEMETERIRSELTSARLQALQDQLNPHFLFNTLNLISAEMHEDVERADQTIADLSHLLRYSLRSRSQPLVLLGKEIAAMRRYQAIIERRFGDRCQFQWRINQESKQLMVPAMLLQPILENSVKYAVEAREEGGSITIETVLHDDRLLITVEDSGHGGAGEPQGFGIGLESVSSRLETIYGESADITVELAEQLSTVSISLPAEWEEEIG